jgi:hypothetical protein
MLMIDGQIAAEFLKMSIAHPRMARAHKAFDNLRLMKRLAPNKSQRSAFMFAPTQSGKSKTVENYIETIIVDEVIAAGLFPPDADRALVAKQQRLAIHVTLEGNATTKSMASDILKVFRDPHAYTGTAPALLGRVYTYMERFGTQILFLDEIQHLDHRKAGEGDKVRRSLPGSSAVPNNLKTMLIRGLVPIVFIGIDEAKNLILGENQLGGRCLAEIEFPSLRASNAEERGIFINYLALLGIKLKEHNIMPTAGDLISADLPPLIHVVAGGRLGMASNFVAAACMLAREQGATAVRREHLSLAVDEWAIPTRVIDYNPFVEGIKAPIRRGA